MHSTCVTDKLAQPGTNGAFLEKKSNAFILLQSHTSS